MDAYSISTSASSRFTASRVGQDLEKFGFVHGFATMPEKRLQAATQAAAQAGKGRFEDLGRKPHVGVIGAGLAGLRCTDVLLERGFQVTLLEGRNRLGGRVHQENVSGHLVDLGPNWIHGTDKNIILDLAEQTGTTTSHWDTTSSVYDDFGQLLATPDADNLTAMMWSIVEAAFAHSNKSCKTISPDESLYDFFKQEVVKRIPDSTPGFERKRECALQIAESWGAYTGTHIKTQSLKYCWLEQCLEGETLFCAGTYQKILERVAKPAVSGANVRCSTKVIRINTLGDEGDKGRVTVVTEGGEILEFDQVVMTAPLGWLKQHPDVFNPPLPSRLTNAISSISYGCLEKVYINFPKAFWLDPDSQGCSVKGFCQWISPEYAPDSNSGRWNQEVVELASLDPANAHPTLLFYIYGEQSRHITGKLAQLSSSKEKRDAFLVDFFRPYYSRLPNYDAASPECQPAAVLATEWLNDELAGHGSYSNFQIGLQQGDADVETMRAGLPQRGLWLAGEHTAPFVALGTATGAYWSGQSVGERIAEAYGRMGERESDSAAR